MPGEILNANLKESTPWAWPSHTHRTVFGRQQEEQRLAPNNLSELSSHVEMQELVPIHNKQEETSSLLILNLKDERHLL